MRFIALIFLLCAAGPMMAGPFDNARVELLPGWRTAHGTQMAALRVTLAPGWKTYWRAPGDAGIPPSFDWSGSQNLGSVQMHWPVPEVKRQDGLNVIGYSDQLVLPMEFTLDHPGPAHLRARIDLGICQDICVPITASIAGDLPDQSIRDPQIVAALLQQPAQRGAARCSVTPGDRGLTLTAQISGTGLSRVEHVAIETGNPRQWNTQPKLSTQGETLIARTHIGGASGLERSALRFTVMGQGQAVEITGCDTP